MKNIYMNRKMSKELLEAIEGAKALIDKSVILGAKSKFNAEFDGYQPTYYATNENIYAYLNAADLSNKENALAVTGSGDHTFNLVTEGILDVDTFDVNKLSEYVAFGLKKAMILKYSYYEYITNSLTFVDSSESNEKFHY